MEIEELDAPDDSERIHKATNVRIKRKKITPSYEPSTTCEGGIPGTQSIFVKTWGCTHNNSDSEYMAGLLSAFGYDIILDDSKREKADLWLLNSCTVKGPSEMKFVNYTKRAIDNGKHVVVAGCVPQGEQKRFEKYSMVGVQQIDRVVEVVQETLKGRVCRYVGSKRREHEKKKGRKRKDGGASLHLPKIRKNPLIEIIAINTGCLNTCTYCKTKHARGDLGSYPPDEICKRVQHVIEEEGVKEIWLTSEDTGAYGLDIGTNIAELLTQIAETVESAQHPDGTKVMIRVGMTNPPYIKNHMEAVAKTLKRPNFYEFLHLPVQSGADDILDDMRRKYKCADFERLCDYLLEHVPGIHIMTDFICGFPGEQPHHHEESMKLVRKYKFRSMNISQFYPRPGTVAASLPKLNTKIVKSRSREMSEYFHSYMPYENCVGNVYEVLVTEKARSSGDYVGHNKRYEQIIIRGKPGVDFMGCTLRVKITETGEFHQVGEVLDVMIDHQSGGGLGFYQKLAVGAILTVGVISLIKYWRR